MGNNTTMVDQFVTALAQQFSTRDLGLLTHFLGVEVVPNKKVSQFLNDAIFRIS